MKAYRPAKKRITVSVGESVRILRELQELSQSQLARLTGISQATISGIAENCYYWRAYAVDRASNMSLYSSTRSFVMDLSSPTLTVGRGRGSMNAISS